MSYTQPFKRSPLNKPLPLPPSPPLLSPSSSTVSIRSDDSAQSLTRTIHPLSISHIAEEQSLTSMSPFEISTQTAHATSLQSPHSSPLQDWWKNETRMTRPWRDLINQDTVPPEQTEAYRRTAKAIAKATGKKILSTAGDITHEVLDVGGDLLKFVPVPGMCFCRGN